jgi:hypothetical protein
LGVCSIAIGDDPHQLVKELQDRFPKAELIGGDQQFERTVSRVVAFVENPSAGGPSPEPVRRILWPWLFRATAWCGRTVRSPVTAGASSARRSCCLWKARRFDCDGGIENHVIVRHSAA